MANKSSKAKNGSNWELGMSLDFGNKSNTDIDTKVDTPLPPVGKGESKKSGKGTSTFTIEDEKKPSTTSTTITTSSSDKPVITRRQPSEQWKGWTDGDLEERLHLLEDKGWDERTNAEKREYLDIAEEMEARHPESADAKNRADIARTAGNIHNKIFFNDNYQDIIDSDKNKKKAEEKLYSSGGKPKGIYGPTVAFLLKEFGDPRFAVAKKSVEHKLIDASNGEELEGQTVRSKKELDAVNKRYAEWRKEQGLSIAAGKDGKYDLVDKEGKVISTFKDKASAEKWFYHHYDMGEATGKESHSVSYKGQSYSAENEEEAKNLAKTFNNQSRGERVGAVATWLSHLVSGIFTRSKNDTAQFLGQGRPYQSTWQQEINNRIKGNNEMYYEHEKGKNNVARSVLELAANGKINLNNLTNQEMATYIALVGRKNAELTIDIQKRQELLKDAALDWRSWDADTQNAYIALRGLEGANVTEQSLAALLSGKATVSDLANIWRKKTNLDIAKDMVYIQGAEKAVEAAGLQNKLTSAQVDVIKELVAEQLKAAKLSNAIEAEKLATTAVDSIAKILDAAIPG